MPALFCLALRAALREIVEGLPEDALVVAYLVMGVLCLSLPLWLGFELRGMLAVLFAVRVLHQVSQPSEASAVPMVATHEELASANSFLSLMSSAGEVVGKALLAPLIDHAVIAWNIRQRAQRHV